MKIDLASNSRTYGVPIRGLIHVGANDGQELDHYLAAGIDHILFFEPLKEPYARLCRTIAATTSTATIETMNYALGAEEGEAEIFVASNGGASSSLLEPAMGPKYRKRIDFGGKETVSVKRLDSLLPSDHNFNVLILDVQGYELEVLKGATDQLPRLDFVISELNRRPQYKDSAVTRDIDGFLAEHSFCRMETHWESRYWGDGLYVRESLVSPGRHPVEIDHKKPRGPIKRVLYSIIGRD